MALLAPAVLSACNQIDDSAAAAAPAVSHPATSTDSATPTASPAGTDAPDDTDPTGTEPAGSESASTSPTVVTPVITEPPPTTVEATTTTLTPANIEPAPPAAVTFVAVGGAGGRATADIQHRLLDLGFWVARANGSYDLTTKQAVMAFQKYIGIPATGKVDAATALHLQAIDTRPHGTADVGDLIEIDKDKQLLFVIRGGRTVWTINASTGSGKAYSEPDKNHPGEVQSGVAITVSGMWKVNLERTDGWWPGDLGEIYRPKYFHGGEAVHGSNNVPNYPASHGCVRVSTPAMDFIWDQNLMPMKSPVWVHGG